MRKAGNVKISEETAVSRSARALVEQGIEAALNQVGVGIWEHVLPEDHAYCSDGLYHLLGFDPADGGLTPEFWISRVHPEDRPMQNVAYGNFLSGLTTHYEESYRVRHANGQWRSVLSRMQWVTRRDGKEGRCMLGFIIDDTDRVAAVERLQRREAGLRTTLSALSGVVYETDLETQSLEVHRLRSDESMQEWEYIRHVNTWLDSVHAEDLQRVEAVVKAHRQSGQPYELTYRIRHPSGGWRQLLHRGSYSRGTDGKPARAYGVIEDVTAEHEQREQLRVQAAIIERMSEGVLLISPQGNILFANPALERLLGYASGDLSGSHAAQLSFRGAAAFESVFASVLESTAGDNTTTIDIESRHRNGTAVPVQVLFSSIELGSRRCLVGVISDLRERRDLERDVMHVATRVQQRIGGDLHDGLGQQLAGIAMMLQGLAQRVNNAGEVHLRKEVDEIVTLVNTAIRSTRSLARGLSPVRPSREGLTEGFEELSHQMSERYRVTVQLSLALPADLPLDENMATNLYRIAQEGVLNAARHAEATIIQLRLRVANEELELRVADNGKGFDTQQFSAGGMGLRIMRFRAQLFGGFLSIESRPGGGTSLKCRCPLQKSAAIAC